MGAWIERRVRDPSGDRLATAVFVAALVHGLVILGVRFATPVVPPPATPTLEILLVPDGPADAEENASAAYLAQRNQQGSGTGTVVRRSSLPEAPLRPREESLDEAPETLPEPEEARAGQVSALARRALDAERLPAGALESVEPPLFHVQPATPASVGLDAVPSEQELHLRGRTAADGTLLADTRESAIAAYSDGWRRRVERVGTLNFPNEARRRGLSGNPVLEVSIRADGSLETVAVRRSSGHPELDAAAIGIVRLAAPFDPFPAAMRESHPRLRFTYEWQFLDGRLGGDAAVFTEEP